VHADVDARVGDGGGEQPDRHRQLRKVPADGIGERERRRGVAGRERAGFGHPDLAGAVRRRVGAVRAPPPGQGLDAEVDRRRGDADREHALQRRAPSALAAGHGDHGGDAEPQP
jgi:hypothetical protein